jgi:hypothetical protein
LSCRFSVVRVWVPNGTQVTDLRVFQLWRLPGWQDRLACGDMDAGSEVRPAGRVGAGYQPGIAEHHGGDGAGGAAAGRAGGGAAGYLLATLAGKSILIAAHGKGVARYRLPETLRE